MPPRVTKEEWDRRATAAGLRWLEPVSKVHERTDAECLTCGHRWTPTPGNVSQGKGCPACAGHIPLSQAVWDDRAAAVGIQWLEPVTRNSVPILARCQCGHEWRVRPGDVQGGGGCPECAKEVRAAHLRTTQDQRDREAKAAGIRWLEPVKNSQTPTLAACLTCGHTWQAPPGHVKGGTGCPRCAGKLLTQDDWDARASAVGITWLRPVRKSVDKTPAKCMACGHEWAALPSGVRQGQGCPNCGQVHSNEAKRKPQAEWDRRIALVNAEWLEPVQNVAMKAPARCLACGNVWSVTPGTISRGSGCPQCSAAGRGERRLAGQDRRDAEAAAVGIRWLEPVGVGSNRYLAECLTCGHHWRVQPYSINQGSGCPICAGQIVTQADWDERAARSGIEWLEAVKNRKTPTPARCLADGCGYVWRPWPSAIRRGQGCPRCAKYGFDPSAPSRLYLLVLPDPPLLKIGVMGEGRTRLDQHTRRGWQVVRTWSTPTGTDALDLEDSVLSWWDLQGAIPAQRREVPAGIGFTECVHVGRVDVPGTLAYIESLIADKRTGSLHGS